MSPRYCPAPTRGTARVGLTVAAASAYRLHTAGGLRRQFSKVFPTHWSFLRGEIPLDSDLVRSEGVSDTS